MKILFGQKYYGKDTSEVPSGFLVWIIEEFQRADWSLINACKQELACRMKLDWEPPTQQEDLLQKEVDQLRKKLEAATREQEFLLDTVMMSIQCKGNRYILEGYLNNRPYMESIMRQIKDAQAEN